MGKESQTKGFIIGAAVGGFIGAVTALFLAPKSGKELRRDVVDKKDDLIEKTDELREKGAEWISIAKEKTIQAKDVVVEKGAQVKDIVVEKADDIKDTVVFTGQKVISKFSKEEDEEACECEKDEPEDD